MLIVPRAVLRSDKEGHKATLQHLLDIKALTLAHPFFLSFPLSHYLYQSLSLSLSSSIALFISFIVTFSILFYTSLTFLSFPGSFTLSLSLRVSLSLFQGKPLKLYCCCDVGTFSADFILNETRGLGCMCLFASTSV